MVHQLSQPATRVLQISIALTGLLFLQALARFLGNGTEGIGPNVLLFIIPVTGYFGARRRRLFHARVFTGCNCCCAVLAAIALLLLVGVVGPSMRCLCDKKCRESLDLSPMHDVSDGEGARNSEHPTNLPGQWHNPFTPLEPTAPGDGKAKNSDRDEAKQDDDASVWVTRPAEEKTLPPSSPSASKEWMHRTLDSIRMQDANDAQLIPSTKSPPSREGRSLWTPALVRQLQVAVSRLAADQADRQRERSPNQNRFAGDPSTRQGRSPSSEEYPFESADWEELCEQVGAGGLTVVILIEFASFVLFSLGAWYGRKLVQELAQEANGNHGDGPPMGPVGRVGAPVRHGTQGQEREHEPMRPMYLAEEEGRRERAMQEWWRGVRGPREGFTQLQTEEASGAVPPPERPPPSYEEAVEMVGLDHANPYEQRRLEASREHRSIYPQV